MPFADTISTGRVAAASLGKAGLIVSSTPWECKFTGGRNPFFRISKCILQRESADRDWQAHCLDKKQLAFYIFYMQHLPKLMVAPRWQVDGWEGLPAVSYNILANSLEEKILHMASACIVFGQQKKKLLKSVWKWFHVLFSEDGS